jgi:hypothetical protein
LEEQQQERKLGRRDPSIPSSDWNNRRKELQYLADPLELAEFVKAELKKGKSKEMLQLVRMASNSMQCIVGWNHIIDNQLKEGHVAQAVKIYNDMKKRAQFPDSYTYTILLRGLAENAHGTDTVVRALSIYHSLYAPNSRVEPSIIHTNAALKVCARANDMDALWGTASKIPEKGKAAANHITYTTILNAIWQNLLVKPPPGETEEQLAMRRERGISEGRRIWEEIVGKWRNADIILNEELVCSMGRLLLIGSRPRDWDDVLSLVEQTMDIPRLVPRLGTPARNEAGYPQLRAPNVIASLRFDDDHLGPGDRPARGDEFLPVTTKGPGTKVHDSLVYVRPGNNTLSMIQEACLKVVANKAATEYWNLLIDPATYNVVPDVNNLHHRLRILRQNRASGDTVDLLRFSMIDKGIKPRPGTFRIAMSTCVRDKNNHRSLRNATQILEMMNTCLQDADPKAVMKYAELAIDFPLAKGADLVDALARLEIASKSIRLQLEVGGATRDSSVDTTYLGGAEREDAINALRRIYGVYDRLIASDLIEKDAKKPFIEQRSQLSSYLTRLHWKIKEEGKKKDGTMAGLEVPKQSADEEVPSSVSEEKEYVEGKKEWSIGRGRDAEGKRIRLSKREREAAAAAKKEKAVAPKDGQVKEIEEEEKVEEPSGWDRLMASSRDQRANRRR